MIFLKHSYFSPRSRATSKMFQIPTCRATCTPTNRISWKHSYFSLEVGPLIGCSRFLFVGLHVGLQVGFS